MKYDCFWYVKAHKSFKWPLEGKKEMQESAGYGLLKVFPADCFGFWRSEFPTVTISFLFSE